MKHSLSRPRRLFKLSSFTLVELLVVMGIIAILAAVILYAGTSALKTAKRTKAFNMASQIQTAAMAYYTEYGVYPVPPGTSGDYILDDQSASATGWQSIIYCLCGNAHPSTGLTTPSPGTVITNSHGVAFLTMKAGDVDANDAPLNPLPTATNLYFNIAIDSDYDGSLGVVGNTAGKLPNFSKSTPAAMDYTGTSTTGVVLWENCNGSVSSKNPNFWVHTY